MRKLDTSFQDWIDSHGPSKLSKMLKTRHSAICVWRYGRGLPKVRQMKHIKELTKGKIGYDQIIEGSCSPLMKRGGRA